jgi:hypothetical protein
VARKFLYAVAFVVFLVVAGAIALNIWSKELTRLALVPTADFVEQTPLETNAYQDPAMWLSRPGIGTDDPARWQPAFRGEGRAPVAPADAAGATPDYAVFFVHPTSYIERSAWNAPLSDERANRIARVYVKGMASPFNSASEIWAPRYRQATFGAFLTDSPEARQAIEAAYRDVHRAFRFFLDSVDPGTPIVLAGHSQGALHLLRLLREDIAGTPLKKRIAAVYIVGWPISVEHDLPALGLPACATPGQAGCVMSWSSYAEPADPSELLEYYSSSRGFDGGLRGDSEILCTNPLTGGVGGEAPASANLGTLVPDADLASGELVPGAVPARCGDRGLLYIGDPPKMGSAVLPGNNYHVYDIPLFWQIVHEDVARRVAAWKPAP